MTLEASGSKATTVAASDAEEATLTPVDAVYKDDEDEENCVPVNHQHDCPDEVIFHCVEPFAPCLIDMGGDGPHCIPDESCREYNGKDHVDKETDDKDPEDKDHKDDEDEGKE